MSSLAPSHNYRAHVRRQQYTYKGRRALMAWVSVPSSR